MVPGENTMVALSEPSCAADEERVLCIIRDMTNSLTQTKFSLNYPTSMTCYNLIEEIGKKLGYDPTSILVSYEKPVGTGHYEEVILNDVQVSQLGELCVTSGTSKRNNFNVLEKDGPPIKVLSEESPDRSPEGAPASCLDGVSADATFSSSGACSTSLPASSSSYSYSSLIKSDTGYVGLVNQAMTCYLSSLLQTLYMTPEFRNAVYRWAFVGTEEEASKSIPYQLQKLFLLLQTSKRRAIETTDITRSFGWDSSEAWQQHDVQELCRVMFDALEKTWGKSGQGDFINKLYQGKMKDYVKCLECGYESARTDTYLDVPLVIQPFGSDVCYSSVEQAVGAFVEPEILDGNNQYFCEKCNKKCNAHKGLKFLSFPYLLTLQLKRFDFDYASLRRIKLNDRVTFPGFLSLSHLIEGSEDEGLPSKVEESQANGVEIVDKMADHSPGAASSLVNQDHGDETIDEGIDIGYNASGISNASGDTSSLSNTEAAANDKNLKDSKKQGAYEYELLSIMIHSGSAAGGHYYAYIKSFEDNQWYSFNDQHVSSITADDIKKTYGGAPSNRGYYSSTYASSTNAYMLMYRQIDPERNDKFYTVENFPQHLKDELNRIREREETDRRQRELDKNLCKIRLFCFHPEHSKLLESRLVIHKDKSLLEATEIAWQLFELEKTVPLDCCRLVKYDETLDYIDQSYDGKDDLSMGVLLGGVKLFYAYELLLELKQPGHTFQEYKPGGVTVKVHIVDLETETIGPPITVRGYLTQTVDEYKTLISQVAQVPKETMRCAREQNYNNLRLLQSPGHTLKAEGFSKSNKVFIECSGSEDDDQVIFPDTKFYKILDRYENTIRLHITLPPYVKGHKDHQQHETSNSVLTSAKNQSNTSEVKNEEKDNVCSNNIDGCKAALTNSDLQNQVDSVTNSHDTITQERLSPEGQEDLTPTAPGVDHTECPTQASIQSNVNSSLNVSQEDSSKVIEGGENWDLDEPVTEWDGGGSRLDDEYRRYFTAQLHINTESAERTLTVCVDKRVTLGSLKKELEQYVGTSADLFKVYRVYSNSQEVELSMLSQTLYTYSDDSKLVVKIGRALRVGEHRVKVYLLQLKSEEVAKLLVECIFSSGMSVLESKSIVQKELKCTCDMDVPVDRIRLRKKSWKNPTRIYQDDQVYEQDITILSNCEIFLEILDGPERVTDSSHMSVYVRRWHPSLYKVDPLEEIILQEQTLEELRQKLSNISDIPVENVEFTKAKGTFPCEVSLLDIHTDMDWKVPVTSLNMYPLSVSGDGAVICYRDKTEKLMELSDAKKKELQQKENSRLLYSSRIHYSPRKERALKIYTDDSPRNSTSSQHQATNPTPLSINPGTYSDLD